MTKSQHNVTMPDGTIARFWQRLGRRVADHDGIAWAHYKGPFYTCLPLHLKLDLTEEAIRSVFRGTGATALRFPSTTLPGMKAGLYVCDPTQYSLRSVSRKQKNHLNRGLESCEVRPVEPSELLRDGFELNCDTLLRQKREDRRFTDPKRWRAFVSAVEGTPGMMIRGAYTNGHLAAYMILAQDGDWLHLLYKMSRTSDLEHCPNHVLDFRVLEEAATIPAVRWVGNGFTAVNEHEGLDRYKRQMGYEVAEHNLCLHFHPFVERVVFSGLTRGAMAVAKKVKPGHPRIDYIQNIIEGAKMSQTTPESQELELACQQETTPTNGRMTRPGALFPLLRLKQTLQQGGPAYMFQRGVDYFQRKALGKKKKAAVAPRPAGPEEVLNLQPGEWVEVKTMEEIQATLDARNKTRGLLFTPEMKPYVGRRYKVHKRVQNIFLEESKQHRKIKNTVLLENVYCHGELFCCDRSCFLFWKEAWLRRADGPDPDQGPEVRTSSLVQINR